MGFFSLLAELRATAPLVYPEPDVKDRLQQFKYIGRALLFPTATQKWFEILSHQPFKTLANRRPHMRSRLQRPYLTCDLSAAEKIEALEHHYSFLAGELNDKILQNICEGVPAQLATLRLDDTETLGLALRFSVFDREGELSISLRSETTGEWICSLGFTVVHWSADRREILIGGLQGHDFTDEKQRIVSMTRGMRGLRPKALVLFTLQQLACIWKITALKAVSNGRHIYRSFWKRKDVAADYDTFWKESGGEMDPGGLFTLPVVPGVRDIAEIKPNKRSMYRQRYAMLDSLAGDIRQSISEPSSDIEGGV